MTTDPGTSIYASIAGGLELLRWRGRSPTFHDADILGLHLEREGVSRLVLQTWDMADASGAESYDAIPPLEQAVVTFCFEEVFGLMLEDFNRQNVIDELRIEKISADPDASSSRSATGSSDGFEVRLEHCYGLSGYIRAQRVSVSFVPVGK